MKLQRALTALLLVAAALATGCVAQAQSSAAELPAFVFEAGWGRLPNDWVLGEVVGVAVDAADRVWVLHRSRTVPKESAAHAAPPVIVFDSNGAFVRAWGGPGAGYDWPQREHGIHVDAQGSVWITGNRCVAPGASESSVGSDDQVLKFTSEGKFLAQIGRPGESGGNADTKNFHRPATAITYAPANELFVADGYGNHRVIVLDAESGRFKRMWGAFGNVPEDTARCAPLAKSSDQTQFSIVHAVTVSRDGLVYVADVLNSRVQVFDLDGKYLTQIQQDKLLPSFALSPDSEQRYLYVWHGEVTGADGEPMTARGEIQIRDRKTLALVGSIAEPAGQKGPGHDMAIDSAGNLYLARVQGGLQKLVKVTAGAPAR